LDGEPNQHLDIGKNAARVDLILCWLVAPIGLLVATVGLSLFVERLTGFNVPWTVRPALGLAVAIVLAQFGTATATTAKLTLPAILVLAGLGLLLGRKITGPRPGRTEVGVAVLVFLLLATPFLVAGEATWAGYIKLDDTATWLALTSHVFEQGRGLGHLAPSTNQQVIEDYLGGSYPIGSFVPMALMSKVSGQDLAFTFQPSMAVAASMLALLLFELARRFVRGVGAAALISVVASLSALLLGYYLWGGVKELVVAALLPLGPVLAGLATRADWPRRAWAVLSLTIAAIIVVLGPGGALWALPPLVPALVVALRRYGGPGALRLAAPVAALSFVLVLPVIFTPVGPFNPLNGGVTGEEEIGNLIHPLSLLQVAGIWPSVDFRTGPQLDIAIRILAVLAIAAAAAAVVFAIRLRGEKAAPLAGYVAGGAVGGLMIIHFGSPWVDGKTLATLSPAVLFAALLGIVSFGQRSEFRLEAAVAATVVAGVVAWGAFLAYQGTWLAPRSHYTELETIGERFAGQGPALSTEASIYGPRYFLRKLDAEGASDRRRRPVLLRSGKPPEDGSAVDLDSIRPDQLDPYNLLITRRSPAESRPPAYFHLVYSGDHYDVWKRNQAPGRFRQHLSLGTSLDAGAIPSCSEVARLATLAGEHGTLVAARVGTPIAIEFSAATNPPGWETPDPYTIAPSGSGRSSSTFDVSRGSYELWLGGVVFGAVDIYIDGEKVAFERGVLNNVGGMEYLTTVELGPGEHSLDLEYEGASIYPGSAVHPYEIGPLELRAPQGSDLGMVTVSPESYRRLCGRRWDWVEAYGR
jgi:hypothetical protein